MRNCCSPRAAWARRVPQQITRVIIPASIPTVLTGLRLGGALTIIGVVVSEMLTSAAGIGYLVTRYRTILDSPHVFGAIVMILLLSILFDTFARAIERRTMVWQTAGRRQKEAAEPIGGGAGAGVALTVIRTADRIGALRRPVAGSGCRVHNVLRATSSALGGRAA